MPKLFDLVKANIATTGTGTITFGPAFSNSFLTPSEAGCVDSDSVRYVLVDGDDVEVGEGVVGGSVTTMTRNVVFSKIGGVKGTSKINLSGTAYLYFTAISNDILNPADNLSDVASANTSADNIGAFRKGTILGTVSQSGGVPTGAILERGNNANGYYFRSANGLQVCMHFANVNSATGGGLGWTFPATFADNPHVAMNMQIGAGSDAKNFNAQMTYQGISGSGATLTYTTASTVTGHLIAIGRWF